MEKTVGNLKITNSTIDNILNDALDHKHSNWHAIHRLLHDLVISNSYASEWLVNFALGIEFPKNIQPGTEGFIKLEDLYYHAHYKTYEASDLVQQGYIKCMIKSFNGLHSYFPITVLLPIVGDVPPEGREVGLRLDDFHISTHKDEIDKDDVRLPF
jgi:hypothetical protein